MYKFIKFFHWCAYFTQCLKPQYVYSVQAQYYLDSGFSVANFCLQVILVDQFSSTYPRSAPSLYPITMMESVHIYGDPLAN